MTTTQTATQAPTDTAPTLRELVLVPALITLAITGLRLGLEFSAAPAWLASNEAGGPGALVGIAWLPLFFGPWFALRLRPHLPAGKPFWKRLAKTLVTYGLLARIPVIAITVFAIFGEWNTHYEKFPFEASTAGKVGATFLAQLGWWACVWTALTGMLAALVVLELRGRRATSEAQRV